MSLHQNTTFGKKRKKGKTGKNNYQIALELGKIWERLQYKTASQL